MSTPGKPITAVAETLGVFVFVLIAAGVVCVDLATARGIGQLGVALASGFALCAMMYAFGTKTEAHLNPAVTLAALLVGRVQPSEAGRRFVAQLAGAALAGVVLRILFPGAVSVSLGAPMMAEGASMTRAAGVEALVGFVWVFTLAATMWRKQSPHVGPIAIGLVYATAILLLGPITGAAGNPLRAFGPAFACGSYARHGVYWIAPLAGGLVAALAFGVLLGGRLRNPFNQTVPKDEPVADEHEPDDALAAYQRGVMMYRTGQLEEAAAHFATATELRPDWPEPYYYIGMIYRDFGDEENANAFFDAALHYRYAGPDGAWRS